MYKVLIVDDELLVISSLKNRVDWKKYGFEIVGEARNGIAAYEKILQLRPDIVFTDIRMAGMNGLELIQKVNEVSLNIQFVVISGYAEFAYAQKALNYGALGFCLKPFDENEIAGILKKARAVLDKIKTSYENELLTLMEDSRIEGQALKSEIFKALGFECDGKSGVQVVVSIGTTGLSLHEGLKYMELKIGSNKYAYFIEYCGDVHENKYYIQEIPSDIKGIGISKIHYSFDTLIEAMDEACIAANQFFISGNNDIYEYRDTSPEGFDNTVKELGDALFSRNISSIEKVLGLVSTLFQEGNCTIIHALKVYNMFLYIFGSEDADKYENFLETYEQLASQFSDVQEMLAYLKGLLVEDENTEFYTAAREAGNDTYKRVLQYINQNYCNDISVQSTANKFLTNPNYISQLFKKGKGQTFTEYLTGLRVRHACNLLKNADLPVYEIAERAGYKDYFYFAKVFKKVTGKTPTAYRDDK